VILYHCVPKAARRFVVKKLLRAFPGWTTLEYYEPMTLETPQANPDELPILFDPSREILRRFDYPHLRAIDFCYGVFSTDRFRKKAGDYSFTFLRHPIDRFYSGYHHAHHHLTAGTEARQDGSGQVLYRRRYPEMVDLFSGTLESYVDRFVAAKGRFRFNRKGTIYGPIDELFFSPTNLAEHDFIGIVEHMPESLAILNRDLGARLRDDGRINEGPPVSKSRYGEAELARVFAGDIDTFECYRAALLARSRG
jgi:hypothetical protein